MVIICEELNVWTREFQQVAEKRNPDVIQGVQKVLVASLITFDA
jgi:hypothetical protein